MKQKPKYTVEQSADRNGWIVWMEVPARFIPIERCKDRKTAVKAAKRHNQQTP